METIAFDGTSEQRRNLTALARYLMYPGEFMGHYTLAVFDDAEEIIDSVAFGRGRLDCGLKGNGIGHGPYAGIEKMLADSWITYSFKSFGLRSQDLIWCVGDPWRNPFQDSFTLAEHTARRVVFLLEFGYPKSFVLSRRALEKNIGIYNLIPRYWPHILEAFPSLSK